MTDNIQIIDPNNDLHKLLLEPDSHAKKDGVIEAFLLPVLRVARRYPEAARVEIHVRPRSAEGRSDAGWLEWPIIVVSAEGNRLHIGAIQRRPLIQAEFHS